MFYDRIQDCENIWKLLRDCRNVLMLAPRRVGKTQLLHRLKEQAEAQGFRAVVFEVAGFRDEKAFLQRLCEAIQSELGTGRKLFALLRQRLDHLAKGGSEDWRQLLLNTNWPEFAESLLQALDQEQDRNWLIMVDEIAIFVRDLIRSGAPDRAHTFLYWLRNMQQTYRNIRWIYSGSIGLDAVARRSDIEGALVDMEIYPLGPFDRFAATGFIGQLAEREDCAFDPEAADLLMDKLGWLSPYYLEKLARKSIGKRGSAAKVDVAAVAAAVEDLLNLNHRTYWATWREHLTKNFDDPERTHLFSVLNEISRRPQGASWGTLLNRLSAAAVDGKSLSELLDILDGDGFIVADNDSYRFLMPMLGAWWQRHVAQGEG